MMRQFIMRFLLGKDRKILAEKVGKYYGNGCGVRKNMIE